MHLKTYHKYSIINMNRITYVNRIKLKNKNMKSNIPNHYIIKKS